jgi:type II secretory pathway pseudopilin PulG
MNKKKLQSGFTLIELLLYVSLTSIILLASSLFLSTLLQSRIKNQTIAEVEQQGIQVMQMITQAVRNAEAITSPGVGSSSHSLTLDVTTNANDPTIFDLSSDVLRIREGSNSAVDLSNTRVIASSLNFYNLSHTDTPGTIRIFFTLTHINPEDRHEYDFNKTFIGSATLR